MKRDMTTLLRSVYYMHDLHASGPVNLTIFRLLFGYDRVFSLPHNLIVHDADVAQNTNWKLSSLNLASNI